MRNLRALAFGAPLLVLVSACTAGGGGPTEAASVRSDPSPTVSASSDPSSVSVTIGSAGFYEAQLMGEIYAQALEARGFEVQRQLGIGPRDNTQAAITGGQVDLVPVGSSCYRRGCCGPGSGPCSSPMRSRPSAGSGRSGE
ncbi:MAG: hypothetical protein H0U86_07425 [Chloroflexi bacterium]|nr:hypothetical protein [Chloroflexota bacterium]